MSTLADAMFEIEVDEVKQRYKNADEFVPGGELQDLMKGGGMVASSTAEYIPIYSTKDGTVSMVVGKVAAQKCRRKPDGTRDFTLDAPGQYTYMYDPKINGVRKVTERFKCFLHPEHEHRGDYDEIGLAGQECSKSNIPTEFQLQMHMKRRHSEEWKTIESHEARRREDDDRAMQRQMLEAMTRRGPGRPPKEEGV